MPMEPLFQPQMASHPARQPAQSTPHINIVPGLKAIYSQLAHPQTKTGIQSDHQGICATFSHAPILATIAKEDNAAATLFCENMLFQTPSDGGDHC
jgi:hypothetical protein